MIEIGAFEAKTRFSEILRRVENGEEFSITKRGKKVAILTSPEGDRRKQAGKAFVQLRFLLKSNPLGTVEEIIQWKNEGHK